MPSDRVDVRFKLDPERHEELAALADAAGVTMGELVESIVLPELRERVHRITLAARRLGFTPAGGSRAAAGEPRGES